MESSISYEEVLDTEMVGEDSEPLVKPEKLRRHPAVKRMSYRFDGHGKFTDLDWDLARQWDGDSSGVSWFHVEIPRSIKRPAAAAQYLIDVLCPPLKLQDILSLVGNGPFCGSVDGALMFRVNSAGPPSSKFTQKIAARVTRNMVITVSLGRISRLEFANNPTQSLLTEVPRNEPTSGADKHLNSLQSFRFQQIPDSVVIQEHVLEFLLTMNHPDDLDNPVPTDVPKLLIHIVDTHIDQLQDIVIKLEMELDEVENQLDSGGYVVKKQMHDERRFPQMHLDLQRLLQVIAHGEQVFPRVKDKWGRVEKWTAVDDIAALDVLVGRLRKLKENVGFIANRITAIQAGLNSWQSEQINRKLYYLSFLSIIFLPLSIVTGAFGMNVGGVPWTEQKNPALRDGFVNVVFICSGILVLLLVCFCAGPLYSFIATNRKRAVVSKLWRSTKRTMSMKMKGSQQSNGLQYPL